MPRDAQIQVRRDTSANWASTNPVLAAGEIGLETDTSGIKFGDGTTVWKLLPYTAQPYLGGNKTSGRYWVTANRAAATVSLSGTYQSIYLHPFYLPAPSSVDRVAIEVTTLGTGVVRVGLYAHDPATGRPVVTGGLLFDWGTVDVTSTGIKEITLATASALPAGWSYLATCWQSDSTTAPTLRANSVDYSVTNGPQDIGTTNTPMSATRSGFNYPNVTGAFGNLGTFNISGSNPARFAFRTA